MHANFQYRKSNFEVDASPPRPTLLYFHQGAFFKGAAIVGRDLRAELGVHFYLAWPKNS